VLSALLPPWRLLPSLRAHLAAGDQAHIVTAWTTAAAASSQVLLLHGLGTEHAPVRARLCFHDTICLSEVFARCAGRAAAWRASLDQARRRAEPVPPRRARCARRLHALNRRAPVLVTDVLQLQAVPPCCWPTMCVTMQHRCALANHVCHHTAQLQAVNTAAKAADDASSPCTVPCASWRWPRVAAQHDTRADAQAPLAMACTPGLLRTAGRLWHGESWSW